MYCEKKVIRICAKNVKKHLDLCKLNRYKIVTDHWKRVIFSDEYKVEVGME